VTQIEHEDLTAELRVVRGLGFIRLRAAAVPVLTAAAGLAGFEASGPRAVEDLVRSAVGRLGGGDLQRAAELTFGTPVGMRGDPAPVRRRRAADVYTVTVERFRHSHERTIISQVADAIQVLSAEAATGSAASLGQSSGPPSPLAEVRDELERVLRRVAGMAHLDSDDTYRFGRYGPFALPFGAARSLIVVDLGAVEELRDVDLIVSSENTYFEPARVFTTTLSGQLRNAAASRDASGMIIRDTIAEELAAWVQRHARPGNPVEPGVVAATSPGELARRGVRRILHAAVAVPRRGSNGYDVPETGVVRAIQRCFELARAERASEPSVDSLSIPLFGAGDGGLDAEASFSRLWPALQMELRDDPTWTVHLTTWTVAETAVVLRHLAQSVSDPA